MADLTVEQRLTRLELIDFPNGILTSDDGVMSVVPAPTPIRQGETAHFTVAGLVDPDHLYNIYSDREDICAGLIDADGKGFTLKGVNAGPAGARAQITVSRDGPGVVFFVDITPAGNLSAVLTAVAS